MGLRRLRGFGCLGCLPFGGLFGLSLPLILIVAVIYFLVNRPKSSLGPAVFCRHCGKPIAGGSQFCAGCGRQVD